jgi:hypothetical protein
MTSESDTVLPGSSVQFTANATGSPSLTYQWYFNPSAPPDCSAATMITGATSKTYSISSVSQQQAGYYVVIASNAFGSNSKQTYLSVFKTQSNAIIAATTISSGGGYTDIPKAVITGSPGTGSELSISAAQKYVRRIRITGGNKTYTTKPTVSVTGGGNSGFVAVPILKKVISDYAITNIPVSASLASIYFSPSMNIQINANGSSGIGATANPVISEAVGGSIVGIQQWDTGNNIMIEQWGLTPDYQITCKPYFITQSWCKPVADIVVTSVDGNGSGCTATVTFNDVTSSFRVGSNRTAALFYPAMPTGYTSVWLPQVTLTNGGYGYTKQPNFNITGLHTVLAGTGLPDPGNIGKAIPAWAYTQEPGSGAAVTNRLKTITYDRWPLNNGLPNDTDSRYSMDDLIIDASWVGAQLKADQWPVMTYPPPNPYAFQNLCNCFANPVTSPEMRTFMNSGGAILPFPPGSIIIEDNVKLTGIHITNPGHSYGLQTNCTIKSYPGSSLPGDGIYMSKWISTPQIYTGEPVVVSPISTSYILDSIGIISQGNGFTSQPTVTISGSGGSALAVADMTYSALGPITPSNPNKLYSFPPTLVLTPAVGNENASGAWAVPILNTATSNANTGIDRLWITNWKTNAYVSFYAHLEPGLAGSTQWVIDRYCNDVSDDYAYNGHLYGTGVTEASNTDFALTISAPTGANPIPAGINGGVSTMSWNLRDDTTNSNYFSINGVSISSGGQGYNENTTAAVSIVPLDVPLPPEAQGTVPTGWVLRRVNPYRFVKAVTPAELQVLTNHTISQIAIVDNGEGYIAPPSGKLYKWEIGEDINTLPASDTTVGSNGYHSDFTASVTSPGTGYSNNNSSFNNRTFVQGFNFTSNQGFTSAPTVSSEDGNGSFFATISQSGVNLSITGNGGSGYTKWRDGDTNLIYDISTFDVVPNALDADNHPSGAPLIPVITGGITQVSAPQSLQNTSDKAMAAAHLAPGGTSMDSFASMFWNNVYPSTVPLPFLPSSGNPAMGSGYWFNIINEPGDNGSGLEISVLTQPFKTLYQSPYPDIFGELYKFYPIPYVSGFDPNDCYAKWVAADYPVISGFQVTNTGSGYTKPPKILFYSHIKPNEVFYTSINNILLKSQHPSLSNKGILTNEDSLVINLSSILTGRITEVVNQGSGNGYVHIPTVSIKTSLPVIAWQKGTYSPSIAPGTDAVIIGSVSNNAQMINNIYITNQGFGWAGITGPTLQISGPDGAIGTATPIMGSSFMKVQINNGGVYKSPPKVSITDAGGKGFHASAIALTVPFTGNTAYISVSEVAFSFYGMAYQSPVITFVRNPEDAPFSEQVDATASANMIYDSNWPAIASGVQSIGGQTTTYYERVSDGYGGINITRTTPISYTGSGALFGLSVSGDLEIVGKTGPAAGVVTIPKSVSGIGSGSFVNDSEITTVVFEEPSHSTYIGDGSGNPVFSNCAKLTTVYLSSSIDTIYPNAFNNCPNLKTIVVEGNTGPLTYSNSFTGCSPRLTVYVPSTFVTFRNSNGLDGYTNVANATVTSEIRNAKPVIYETVTYKAGAATNPTDLFGEGPVAVDASGNIFFGYYPYGNISGFGGDRLIQLAAGVSYTGTTNAYSITYGFTNIQSLACYENYVYVLDCVPGDPQYIYYVVSGVGETLGLDGYYVTAPPVRISAPPIGHQLTSIACDKNGNLYAVDNTGVVWLASSTKLSDAISSKGIVKLIKYGAVNAAVTSIACDSKGAVYVTLPNPGCVIKFPEDSVAPNAEGSVYATGLSNPCSITFDNVDNMYVSNLDSSYASGISILKAGETGQVQTLRNGGPNADYIAINPVTDSLLFVSSYLDDKDSYRYLYNFPLKGNTTAPPSLVQALTSHDYDTIAQVTNSTAGADFVLSTSDIAAINSTLSSDAQVELPEVEVITYICPNYDGSVTLPDNPADTSVFIATSFPPDVSTMLTIGNDTVYVVFNSTSPPTLTISGPGVTYSKDINPGDSFTTVSGTTVTVYSIGLTVFNAVYGAVFVPGVGGVPPPVCKPKRQGIDYSLFLSSQLSNADVQQYKQKGPVDASEWIRRKRVLASPKFGTC